MSFHISVITLSGYYHVSPNETKKSWSYQTKIIKNDFKEKWSAAYWICKEHATKRWIKGLFNES